MAAVRRSRLPKALWFRRRYAAARFERLARIMQQEGLERAPTHLLLAEARYLRTGIVRRG